MSESGQGQGDTNDSYQRSGSFKDSDKYVRTRSGTYVRRDSDSYTRKDSSMPEFRYLSAGIWQSFWRSVGLPWRPGSRRARMSCPRGWWGRYWRLTSLICSLGEEGKVLRFRILAYDWRFAPILASHVFLVIIFVHRQTHRHTDTLAI